MDGKTQSIGRDRAIVLDVVRMAQSVPSFPVEREFELQELADVRANSSTRISWVALFTKAYGLASRQTPELRRLYVGFPWPRFHQSPYSVVSIAVNRQQGETERLFFGRIYWPEDKSLLDIQSELDCFKQEDVNRVFRQQVLSSRMPSMLRRVGWWCRQNFSLEKRARRTGTGGLSTLAGAGVLNRLHPCMLTSSLSYGPIEETGRMWVTLQCDHRLIDGAAAARAINVMHDLLHGVVCDELRALAVQKTQIVRDVA